MDPTNINDECKKSYAKEYILYDSIYIKFKNRQSKSGLPPDKGIMSKKVKFKVNNHVSKIK